MTSLDSLLTEVRACRICAERLPLGPRPVVQLHASARILIAGQAPGRKVHETGVPFADASGDRLRSWMGISREVFYDAEQVAILPMGFCFPGTGTSGDLAPRAECALAWRAQLLARMNHLQLTLVIGQYALAYHLPEETESLTEVVRAWRRHWPRVIPLPHPSPRNNLWLKRNPWFEGEVLPQLQGRISAVLAGRGDGPRSMSTMPDLQTVLGDLAQAGITLPSGRVFLDQLGDSPELSDKLIGLIRGGGKRAGASLLWMHEQEQDPVPSVGDIGIVLDHAMRPTLVTRVTDVEVVPFDHVTPQFAAREGEGDLSLDDWRRGHWAFFSRECATLGRPPELSMPIVCASFEVLHVL
jgi:uracil-DNA glycosylase/uncharacterized protein YhfF